MPLVIEAVVEDTLNLEVHWSLVNVDSPEVIVPESLEARLGEQTLEALDDPLALKFRAVDQRVPYVLAELQEVESLLQSQILDYP